MEAISQQLGTLLLGSVPTIILFILLVVAYNFLLHRPLVKTLAERHARTVGAVEKAKAAIAGAEAKAQEYEARLRAARQEIFHARELRIQQWNAEKDAALARARQAAHDQVREARKAIEVQAEETRRQITASVDQLADQILKAVLPAGAATTEIPR